MIMEIRDEEWHTCEHSTIKLAACSSWWKITSYRQLMFALRSNAIELQCNRKLTHVCVEQFVRRIEVGSCICEKSEILALINFFRIYSTIFFLFFFTSNLKSLRRKIDRCGEWNNPTYGQANRLILSENFFCFGSVFIYREIKLIAYRE